MFRANRIGTPHIYIRSQTNSTADWTPYTNAASVGTFRCNAINASPILDFGYTNITWNGTESLPTLEQLALVQQVTVTQPLAGDTVGIEVVGCISILLSNKACIMPVFARTDSATGALFGPMDASQGFLQLEHEREVTRDNTDVVWRHLEYKTQVIMNELNPAGNYVHGFRLVNTTGGSLTLSSFHIKCAARQLNDQENIAYRDTRR